MDYLTFISTLLSSFVWPIVVIFGLHMFKEPISKAIPFINKLKYRDLEVEFNKIGAASKYSPTTLENSYEQKNYMLVPIDSLFEIAKVSPKVAVIEAGRSLKIEFDRSIDRFFCSEKTSSDTKGKEGGNPIQSNPILIELSQLLKIREDLMESYQYEVTEENAVNYIVAANRYCGMLKSICKK